MRLETPEDKRRMELRWRVFITGENLWNGTRDTDS